MLATVTDIQRSLETLNGILKGIISDGNIDIKECNELKFWIDHHKNLDNIYPVFEIYQIIEKAVKTNFLEESEKRELIEYCSCDNTEGNTVFDKFTQETRKLHGFLHGIIANRRVLPVELNALRNWISYNNDNFDKWPFNEVFRIINKILEDGIVTKEEEDEFIEYAKEFTEEVMAEGIIDPSIFINQWMMNDSPAFKTIEHIIDDMDIIIENHSFCFTGQMRSLKRIEAKNLVINKGGIYHDNVIQNTNYLIIGALSNPAWAYSTYGRKIEKVMNNRQKGIFTYIIGEDKFLITTIR